MVSVDLWYLLLLTSNHYTMLVHVCLQPRWLWRWLLSFVEIISFTLYSEIHFRLIMVHALLAPFNFVSLRNIWNFPMCLSYSDQGILEKIKRTKTFLRRLFSCNKAQKQLYISKEVREKSKSARKRKCRKLICMKQKNLKHNGKNRICSVKIKNPP